MATEQPPVNNGQPGEPEEPGHEGERGGSSQSYGRGDTVSIVLDWTVRIIAVLSLVLVSVVVAQLYKESTCQNQFNKRTTILAPFVGSEREAERAAQSAESVLWLNIRPGERTPEEEKYVQALFAEFQRSLEARAAAQVKADKAREANPLPTCNV